MKNMYIYDKINVGGYMKKNVLITGGSRGLGRSCALKFAQLGYNIIINYNNSYEDAVKLESYLKENYNVLVLLVKADISKEEEVINMVDIIKNKFQRIDCLVNNAGIAIDTLFEDKTVQNFRRIIDVNLIGTFLVSKYIGSLMFEEKLGTIINVSSTNGIDTYYPYSLDYDASKAGVISLTHNLARQFAPYIRVNCVAPGWINTEMNKELDKEFIEKENEKILLGRFSEPSEIANVIAFLASDEASYINGSVIRVDGGY